MKNKLTKRVLAAAMGTLMLAGSVIPGTLTVQADEAPGVVKMTYITGGTEPEGLDRIEAALSAYAMEKINCTVELVPVAFADQATKYNMWFANGNDSDIICTVFQDYLSMINAGAFMELDDLIQEYGQDMIEKDKDKDFLSAGKYNDKLYGIPTIPAGPGNGGALYMRKDVYDQLDTSSIDADADGYLDYDDLDSLLGQIAEKCPDYTPLGVSGNRTKSNFFYVKNYDNLGVSGESCGVLVDPLNDTTVENLYATDEYKEYLDWMRKWYLDGYISKDAATSAEGGDELFEAGRAATYIGMSTPGTRASEERILGSEVVQLDLCPTYMTTNVYTGVLFFISKNAQNPEKAMGVLNLLFTDPEFSNILANGEEGGEYTMVDKDNGVIAYNDGAIYTNMYGVWGDGSDWYITEENGDPETVYQERKDYLADAVAHTSKAHGYKFNASELSTEQATVKSVISKYLTQLEYGTVDLDTTYPEFLDALDKAGINKIIEENQKQLDAWLAAQQ